MQRLPTELLVHIFNDVSHVSDPRSSRSLIALTHVCRVWRAIALDVPEPWSSIVVTSLSTSSDGVHSFIKRSRDSLLNIHLQNPHSQVDFRFLTDIQYRLRSLIVEADDLAAVAQAAKQLAWRHSPHLETLCLLGPSADSVWAEILVWDTLPLLGEDEATSPVTLTSFNPSLRYLRMRPMVCPWTSGVYSNLSVLDLDTSRHTGLTEGRLISILRRCPELVELRLRVEGDLAAPRVPPRDGSWDVALPLLSVFSVDGLSPELAASVLSHLTLPAFTRYNLSLCSTGHTGPFIAALPHGRRRLPSLAIIVAVTFEVAANGNTHCTLYPAQAPTVALTLADGTHDTMLPCVPTAALESLQAIKTIGSPESSPPFPLDWHAIFCRLPGLRLLRFDRPAIEDLSRAIDALGLPGGDPPPSLPFPCPALECLQLVSLSLTRDLGDRLANALRRRDEWGLPPLGLEVRNAVGSDAEFAARLGELDVNVVETFIH